MVWDRRFYLTMAVVSALVIFTGFSRTYYLKFRFPMSPELSALVHVHAAVFTGWMVYFVAQTALIAVKRPGLHRSLGLLGAFLGSAVIVMGVLVAFAAVRLHHGSATQDAEVIFLVSLVDIVTFTLFFGLGWVWRRDREAHQRLMLLAVAVGLTGAGIGRLGAMGVPLPVMALIGFGLLLAGPVYDFLTRRRVHLVYVFGVLWAVATFTPLRFMVGNTLWWHHAAHAMARM